MRVLAIQAAKSLVLVVGFLLVSCTPQSQPQASTTTMTPRTGTVATTFGLEIGRDECTPPPSAVPPSPATLSVDPRFPLVGFELWRSTNAGCASSRLDSYQALVSFDMSAQSNLKGLVTAAELTLVPHTLPSGVGRHASCQRFTGGPLALVHFSPQAGTGVAPFLTGGVTLLPPRTPFPASTSKVFDFPNPWSAGSIPGSSTTTTIAAGGNMATFTLDVTGQAQSAINSGLTLAWMLTTPLPPPLTDSVRTSVDCKTPYDVRLTLTHV